MVESITLTRGEGGVFDVEVDGRPVFSKKKLNRHAAPGEIVEKIGRLLVGDGAVAGNYDARGDFTSP
jgi:hypothetical protein